jgi:hypothetical protein
MSSETDGKPAWKVIEIVTHSRTTNALAATPAERRKCSAGQ